MLRSGSFAQEMSVLTQHKVDQIRNHLNYLEQADYSKMMESQHLKVIRSLNHHLSFFPFFVQSVPIQSLFRLTINRQILRSDFNGRIHRISQLKYPPADKCGIGRANLPRMSVLYASFAPIIPEIELRPARGELVTISEWEMSPTNRIRVAAIFQDDTIVRAMPYFEPHMQRHMALMAQQEPLVAEVMRALTGFVARQFIKVVPPSCQANYLVSAWISDLLLNRNDIEAIIYPSVPSRHMDVNVAIRPDVFDRFFRPSKATEKIIRTSLADNPLSGYSSRTARTSEFDITSDTIRWDSLKSVPEEQLPTLHEQM